MDIKNPAENNIFQVLGPSNKEGRVLVKAWDGNTYRIPENMDTNTFAEKLRSKKGPGLFGAISAATSYSVPQLYRTTMASIYDAFGMEEDQKEQEKLAQENQDLFNKVAGQYAIPSFTDVDSLGETSQYVQQQIGFSAPQMIATVGGAAAGAAYSAPLLGAAAISAPFFYAQNVDRQRMEKKELAELGIVSDVEYDQGKALLAAGVQAGLEGVVGKVLFAGNQITKGLTAKLGYTPGTKASQSFLKTMGAVAGTNAITEVGQQFAERWQADLPLLDDEAKQEYLEAGVAAAVVGVPLGAVGHFARRPATEQDAEQVVEAVDAEPVSPGEEPLKERNPLLMQLEEAIAKSTTEPPKVIIPEAATPNELVSSLFNIKDDNQSYGIENVEQAKAYIAGQPNGSNYLASLEKANVSDGLLIESARNNARLQEQQKKYSVGIEGQNYGNRGVVVDSENIATQYSDEPRIVNMAAILEGKYGFDRNHIKGLSDDTIEKLFRIYTDKDDTLQKKLPRPKERLQIEDLTKKDEASFWNKKEALDEEYFYKQKEALDEKTFYKGARDQGIDIPENAGKNTRIVYGSDGSLSYSDPMDAPQEGSLNSSIRSRTIYDRDLNPNRSDTFIQPSVEFQQQPDVANYQPSVDFQKQLLDPEIGNDVADAEYVRKVNKEAPLKELRKIADKLERIEKANQEASPENLEKKRKAEKILKEASKKPAKKAEIKKEKFKKATKEKPVDTDVPVAPTDFKLDTPVADKTLIDRKETILNDAMAAQLREPSKYTQKLNLQGILKGYLDGSLYETARVNYGSGSQQIDLFVFDQFLKTNFKPSNIKSLVNKHKVLLSAKLKILPKDLAFWGDSVILHQGLQEFTQNRDKAFGNDIFKQFLDEQKKIKDYFKNNLKIESVAPSAESILKADKILQETPIPQEVVEDNGKQVVGDLNKLVKDNVPKIKPGRNNTNTAWQWGTSLLSSMKGLARRNPLAAQAMNIFIAKQDISAELKNDFALRYSTYFKSPNFKKFADIISFMKESDQEITTNDNGEVVFKDRSGALKKFPKDVSAEFIKHVDMWKHMGKAYLDATKKYLDNFQDIGLDRNSTPQQVAQVIAGLEEQIKTDTFSDDVAEKAKLQLAPLKDALKIYRELDRLQKENRPYVPFVRFGDHAIKVVDKATGEIVYMADFERPSLVGVQGLATQKEVNDFIAKDKNFLKFKDTSKYKIDAYQLTYNNLNTPSSFITAEMVAGVLGSSDPNLWSVVQGISDKDTEANDALKKGFNKAQLGKERALRYAMSKGGAKFLQKSENIPGYSQDWDRVLAHHLEAMSNMTAMIQTAPQFAETYKNIQLGQMPQWERNMLNSYLQYMQEPKADYPMLRAFNFLYTMGFNFSTATLQLFTVTNHVIPAMNQTGFNPISDAYSVLRNTSKAAALIAGDKNFENDSKTMKLFSKDLTQALRRNKEALQASQTMDALGLSSADKKSTIGKIKNTAEKFTNFAGMFIDYAERSSRYGMFITVYEKLKRNPSSIQIFENFHKDNQDWLAFKESRKDLPIEEAIPHFMVRDVHAVFGKVGRGASQRGLVGSAVFPFTTYVGQTLERMYDLGVHRGLRGKVELAQTMSAYILLAGLAGIPGYELVEELGSEVLTYLTGIRTSVKKEIKDYVKENGFNPLIVEKGLASYALDVDISNRIGLQLVSGRLLKDAFRLTQGKDIDVAQYNPTLGLLPRIGESFEASGRGKDFLETINPVLPSAMRSINQAFGYANEKMLETSKGNPFPLKEDLNTLDLVNRGLGFTPLKVAEARDELFFGKSYQKGKFTLIKDRYADQIARLRYQAMKEPSSALALNRQINALYNELLATLKGDPDFKPTPDFFQGFNRSIKNRLKEKQNPEVNVK